MTDVVKVEKQKRVRVSDEAFIEAVMSSSTYAEIATKTGQKIGTTMARYNRTKEALAQKGVELPALQRAKPKKSVDNVEQMADVVRRIKEANASNG